MMWTIIKDCGKQLTLHTKIREKEDNHFNVYQITAVEFDQYKLELITRNDEPVNIKLQQVLNCHQLVSYNFEVETNERNL